MNDEKTVKLDRMRFTKNTTSSRLALLAIVSVISAFTRGGAGIYVGVVGITAMLLSIYGFYVGMRSFREPDAQVLFPVLGSLVSGITSVLWFAVLLMGVGA